MKKYNVGIIGATGMVGQRFALLLQVQEAQAKAIRMQLETVGL